MVAMQDSGAMCDHLSLFIHGFTETHLDALCHLPVAEGEETWNGRRLDQYGMPTEHRGTVDFWRDGIVTRGVLYDIPRSARHRVRDPGRTGARLGARRRRRGAGHRAPRR